MPIAFCGIILNQSPTYQEYISLRRTDSKDVAVKMLATTTLFYFILFYFISYI